jgi:hypothetical protein
VLSDIGTAFRYGVRAGVLAAAILAGSRMAAGGSAGNHPPRPEGRRVVGDLASDYCRITTWLDGNAADPAGTDVPGYAAYVDQLWAVSQRVVERMLDDHPDLDASGLVRILREFASGSVSASSGAPVDDDFDPSFSALRLVSGQDPVFAVAWNYGWSGTFFVVGKSHGRFELLWDVKEIAEQNFPLRNEIGYWAFLTAGIHDGPLTGRLRDLPRSRGGSPRFLVDAITNPWMGEQCPGQVSIWEWNGRVALPMFVRTYETSLETRGVVIDGETVRIRIREEAKTFFTCGSCGEQSGEPAGVWTLEVGREDVLDLGSVWLVPELKLLDDLIWRDQHSEDVRGIAAPRVASALARAVGDLKVDEGEPGSANDVHILGMMGAYRLRARDAQGGPEILDFESDGISHLALTIEKRGASLFARAITFDAPRSPASAP